MRYVKILLAIVILCAVLSSCVFRPERTAFGFDTSKFLIIEDTDTHGGFLGDGEYNLVLDCCENVEEAKELVKYWKPLPLSDSLEEYLYGEERDGEYFTSGFADEYHWPVITNGVYKFVDRHSETTDRSDETEWRNENRYSVNFSVAIYDFDTNTLYYFSKDT